MILGDDPDLASLINSYKDDGFLVFSPGIVSYSDIEKYIKKISIGFSFYEPLAVDLVGNASQKVRQYLACGKPVFSTFHNHEFLIENNLGSIFKDEDYDLMAAKAIEWLEKIKLNEVKIKDEIRDYAVQNLSCERTFQQRMEIYHRLVREI